MTKTVERGNALATKTVEICPAERDARPSPLLVRRCSSDEDSGERDARGYSGERECSRKQSESTRVH